MENLYINKCKTFINFMLSQQQWDGISKEEINKWLENFRELEQTDLELVYKLLTNIIYFSEADIINILKTGVFYCIAYDEILSKQIVSEFNLSQHALNNIYQNELLKTCFVPLLDSNSPHESGNYVSRLLVQQQIISHNNSMFIEELPGYLSTNRFKRIVIIDDCVGSGDQIKTFWDTKYVIDNGKKIFIKNLSEKYPVTINYLTLFGYKQSIDYLRKDIPELKIICTRYLSDYHRVFSDDNYIWNDNKERDNALALFESLTKNVGIPLKGYKGLDFAFIMHKTIPDWSLPIFWKYNNDWNLLMRRKNSNV